MLENAVVVKHTIIAWIIRKQTFHQEVGTGQMCELPAVDDGVGKLR